MNFDKDSRSEEKKKRGGGGKRTERGGEEGDSNRKKENVKKKIGIRLFFVLMLCIKFQVPGSSGSLVLT